MQYPKLELQIAQVERLIAHSRSKFSNKKKEHIYDNMLLLFDNIKKSDYSKFSSEILAYTKVALNIIFYAIEFLDYKRENEIPKRLIYCLNKVLDQWITDGTKKYFIVVSYNNTPDNFFVQAYNQEYLNGLNHLLKSLFKVDCPQSLIQISKPKFFINDHLSSIPVYHELGHFIDKNNQINFYLSRKPDFKTLSVSHKHFTEFFADLFAAQYIGKSAVATLDETKTATTESHPSNSKRVEVVNTFIEGTGPADCMKIVAELKQATLDRTNLELKIRYEHLKDDENPLLSLTPELIINANKIHSLFSSGWEHWLNPESAVRKKYPAPSECSKFINCLINQSIRLTMQQAETGKLKRIGNKIGNFANIFSSSEL